MPLSCAVGTFRPAFGTECVACAEASWCGFNNTCIEGRRGRGCSECDAGFMPLGTDCEHCPEFRWITLLPVLLALFVAVRIILWYRRAQNLAVIARTDAGAAAEGRNIMKQWASLVVLLTAVQVGCLVISMNFQWPLPVRWGSAVLERIVVFNLVDASAPHCLLSLDHRARFYLRIALPALPVTILGLLNLLLVPFERLGLRVGLRFVTRARMALEKHAIAIFILSYVLIANTAAMPFDCHGDSPGGYGSMRDKPDIECDWHSKEWLHFYAIPGICALVFCAVVIFAMRFYLLRFYQLQYVDDEFMHMFGALYLRFERRFFYWEAVVLVRKLVIVLIARILSREPLVQLVCAATVLFGSLLLQVRYAPYFSDDIDRIETSMLCGSCGIVAIGGWCHFNDPTQKSVVILLFVVFVLSLLAAAPSLRRVWAHDHSHDTKTGTSGAAVEDELDDALPVQAVAREAVEVAVSQGTAAALAQQRGPSGSSKKYIV